MTVKALPIVPHSSEDALSHYALQMLDIRGGSSAYDAILQEIEIRATQEKIPIIGRLEGAIIHMLVALRQPSVYHVLDIGTAIGYSAIWLATALAPGGHVTSIESDGDRAQAAVRNIERAGLSDRVTVIAGDVFEILPRLNQHYDVIFQDVMKHVYFASDHDLAPKLLEQCIAHLSDGGLLLTDNAFCLGEVLEPSSPDTLNQVVGIQAYNSILAHHPQFESVIIPVRDGLWVSRKCL